MNFLNAAMLWGLVPLLGLPLLIHLLNKKFPRLFYFSSVEQLRRTLAQRSKLFRWRHLILLLLRTGFLLLLLLAFLQPVLNRFQASGAGVASRTVLLLVDHSLSMEYQGEGVSCRKRAVLEAEKIIDSLGPNDQVNVLLAGSTVTSCFVDFSRNQAEAKAYLGRLSAGVTTADFNRANAEAARLLSNVRQESEVYYLSDFQRKNWGNVNFTPLPPQARLFFVDVAPRRKENHGILGAEMGPGQVLAGDTVPVEITVGNYSDQPLDDQMVVEVDRRVRFEQPVSLLPWSVVKTIVPVQPGPPGLHLCEIRLSPDDLKADDHFYLTLPVMEKEAVLIVSDDPHPEKDAVYYLKTALNPYEQLQGSLLPEEIRSTALDAGQLAGVKKLFLTRLDRWAPAQAEAVARFLFQGGGAIYFLDGQFDAQNLELLEKAVGPGTMPMKLAGRRVAENIATGAQQIWKGDFRSKFLKLFRGARRQDLGLLEFYDYYQASSTGAGQVLLSFTDESPAMARLDHGLGTLLLLNFSASERAGNLPRQRIFPAWMQELVKQISSDDPVPAAYVVGATIESEVWRTDFGRSRFLSPSGAEVESHREVMGERFGLTFTPSELGFYRLAGERLVQAFGVNPSPDESDLRAVDKSILPDQGTASGPQGFFVAGREDYEELVHGRPIFHYFVLGGCLLLLAELGFQLLVRRRAS